MPLLRHARDDGQDGSGPRARRAGVRRRRALAIASRQDGEPRAGPDEMSSIVDTFEVQVLDLLGAIKRRPLE